MTSSLDKMDFSKENILLKTWSVQKDLEIMEKCIQEFDTEILDSNKPFYDSLKNKLKEAAEKMKTMELSRETETIPEENESEVKEEEKCELRSESLDLNSQVQELEVKVSRLEDEADALVEAKNIIFYKIEYLSAQIKSSSQKFDEMKKKEEKEQDLIILRNFIFQFQNLLGKLFGEEDGLVILQVEQMIKNNHSPQVTEEFK